MVGLLGISVELAAYIFPELLQTVPGLGGRTRSFSLGIEKEGAQLTPLCAHPQLYPEESAKHWLGQGESLVKWATAQCLLHKQQN